MAAKPLLRVKLAPVASVSAPPALIIKSSAITGVLTVTVLVLRTTIS